MSTTWDDAKRLLNLAKHGVDFVDAAEMFDGPTVETEDRRRHYGEARYQALGVVRGRVFYVVYTWRNARRRIISARKASRNEVAIYQAVAGTRPAPGDGQN